MTLNAADWLIIVAYFAASAFISLIYTRKASQSLDEYFLGGPQRALVARRHVDGRDHVRRRHAARR